MQSLDISLSETSYVVRTRSGQPSFQSARLLSRQSM